jgi:pimeloyl-ACP methyl ester carboxylesterase
MPILRIYTGSDQRSHFEEIEPQFEPRGDQSEIFELIAGTGLLVRRFEPDRTNPWHHAPGRYAVFTLSGAVDIEIGDGTVRRISAPTAIVQGADDPLQPLASAQDVAEIIPGSRLFVIPGLGHDVPAQLALLFAAAIPQPTANAAPGA